MKTRQKLPEVQEEKTKKRGLGSVSKAFGVATSCVGLACSGAQVRPAPPPEDCPPGALEAMEELDIDVGDKHPATFPISSDARVITVKEGWTSIRIYSDWEDMEHGTVLSGWLTIGERVWVRLTEARTRDGRLFPVCMELWDMNGGRGIIRESDEGPHRTKVFSSVDVKAVDHFE